MYCRRIAYRVSSLGLLAMFASTATAQPVVYEGGEGAGKGKHILLLAGDHEYRSEETLPALARILAKHHGFTCTVLFTVDRQPKLAMREVYAHLWQHEGDTDRV